MRAYYYIVSSFPEISLEENIEPEVFQELYALIKRNLHPEDKIAFSLLQYPADIHSIINGLAYNKKSPKHYPLIIGPPTMSEEEVTHVINKPDAAPPFAQAVFGEERDWEDESLIEIEKQLTEAFYIAVKQEKDDFLRSYFRFDKDLKNITTALNAHQYQFDAQPYLIDYSWVLEQIKQHHPPDFGISDVYTFTGTLWSKIQGDDPVALEKYLDQLRWSFIDDHIHQHFFDRQVVYGYFIKLQMAYKWSRYRSERNEEKIIDLLTTGALEQFDFPAFMETL